MKEFTAGMVAKIAAENNFKLRFAWEVDHIVPSVMLDAEELATFLNVVQDECVATMKEEGYRQCAVGQRTTQYCGMAERARKEGYDSRQEEIDVLTYQNISLKFALEQMHKTTSHFDAGKVSAAAETCGHGGTHTTAMPSALG